MSVLQKIRKRDGSIDTFDSQKIRTAIIKATVSVRGRADNVKINELTALVLKEAELIYTDERMPSVEGIQDIVEKTLMVSGYFDIAKAYILYRERHKELREEKQRDVLRRIQAESLNLVKRDGTREPFNHEKLKSFIQRACFGYDGVVDVEELTRQCEVGAFEGMTTEQVSQLAVMTSRSLVERDPVIYSTITSRLFLASLYREVFGRKYGQRTFAETYRTTFIANLQDAVAEGKLSPKILEFDLDRLAESLALERDGLIPYRGLQTLYDRYFVCSSDGRRRLETPQMFWMRVALGLALNEGKKEDRAIEFYGVLSTLRFVSSTPTLFHSGTPRPQMSSCYITTVDDSLESIFKSIADNAQLSKWSGGIGNDWSRIRGTGALITSTHVESQGVIPFLKIANDTTVAINRSGKRRGATCAYLEVWHYDIEDFIELRRNTGDDRRRTHDMDTAVWVPDLFMKRVMSDQSWMLFSPDETSDLHESYGQDFEDRYLAYEEKAKAGLVKLTKSVRAKDLWRKIISALYETGHPWITFKDPCNVRSPQDHAGVVHSSNLCTEITLNTSSSEIAVCNLGSVNLAVHVRDGKLDAELLRDTIVTAMRMLDDSIDINYYPVGEARESNLKHRPVGLGIMGWQDALYKMDVRMDSEEAVELSDRIMEMVAYHAILASTQLAAERGAYQSFKGSKWDRGILPLDTLDILETERQIEIDIPRESTLDWTHVRQAIKEHGMRNSNCLAIAPTATISNIAGCFPSTEPTYNNLYVKSNMSGEFTVVNEYLVNDLKARGLWTQAMVEELKYRDGDIQQVSGIPKAVKDKYRTTFEIDPQWLIRQAARRGKWIDQSQALTIFTNTTSGNALSDVYFLAWALGLKTTYYLRTLGASTIEKSTLDITSWKHKSEVAALAGTPEKLVPDQAPAACAVDNPECESCQ